MSLFLHKLTLINKIDSKRSKLIIALAVAFICLANSLHAQYDKYIISFTDKNNSPYSLSTPSAYLSAQAVARRAKYNIALDSTDLPVNPAYIQRVLSKGNITLLVQSRWLNDILILTTDTAALTAINTLPFVKKTAPVGLFRQPGRTPVTDKFSLEKNTTQASSFTGNISGGDTLLYGLSSNQVHIHHGEFLHNKGYTGKGITIAVLDAGFYHYKSLTAFDSIRANNQVLAEKDFVAFDNSVNEDDTHGMECLSTIAANLPGVMVGTAPKANFLLLRSENSTSEYPVEEHNWVTAAEYADSAGADLISSSLGYNQFDDPNFNHTYADIYANSTMVTKGAAMAVKKGLIVTNSAGNEGNKPWKYIVFPADADSVCTVGAVDNNGAIASFSSYGYPGKVKPSIVSVGSGTTVFSSGGVPVSGYGTSFSNPNINGLIACLWQAFPRFNNMAILDAVYKSADRYNTPDDRYGYGIPNMQTAYLLLKQKQNILLYGNDWLFANPNPFTDSLHITLIGQLNGPITLTLKDESGNTIKTITLVTEAEEVYDTVMDKLLIYPAGNYTLTYNDGATSRNILLTKKGIVLNSWLQAAPVPFGQQLTVYVKAPETGPATIKLINMAGTTVATYQLTTTTGSIYTIPVDGAGKLAKGVYVIQYTGATQKKAIKVVKG